MKRVLFVVLLLSVVVGCTRNVSYVKDAAESRLSNSGYTIVAYEGYQWSLFFGGLVWYQVTRSNPNIRYTCCLAKRGNEIMVANVELIDKVLVGSPAMQGETGKN